MASAPDDSSLSSDQITQKLFVKSKSNNSFKSNKTTNFNKTHF